LPTVLHRTPANLVEGWTIAMVILVVDPNNRLKKSVEQWQAIEIVKNPVQSFEM
jgi:hypothetical protein